MGGVKHMKPKRNRTHPFDSEKVLSASDYFLSEKYILRKYKHYSKYVQIAPFRESLLENGSYSYKKTRQKGCE